MNSKVTTLRNNHSEESAAAQVFRKEALNAATELLDAMFDGADDALFTMADQADDNAARDLHFEAMRAARQERPHISRSFISELAHALTHGPAGSGAESEEPEESAALANMVSRATSACRPELSALEARLRTLATDSSLSTQGMSPQTIGQAFKQSMQPLNLEIGVKLLIYGLFDRTLAQRLAAVYKQLLSQLEQRNVAPYQAAAQSPTRPQIQSAPAAESGARRAQRLAAARREIAPEAHYGTGEVLSSLGAFSGGGAPDTAIELVDQVVQQLRSSQQDTIPRQLHRKTQHTLARVATMFADVLQDPRVAAPVRPMLERLRLPLLKTALLDVGFFRDAGHPGRHLVNELATLDVAADDAVAAEASVLIERVADGFDEDPGLLEEAAVALRQLSRRQAPQSTDGKSPHPAEVARSKRLAILELRQQTLGRHLPDPAKPFLLKALGPYLAIQHLQHGPASQQWQDGANLLARVIDALQPARRDGEHYLRRDQQASLVPEIRERLSGFATSRAGFSEALAALERGFVAANDPIKPADGSEHASGLAEFRSWDPDQEVFDDTGGHDFADAALGRALATAPAAATDDGHAGGAAAGSAQPEPVQPDTADKTVVDQLLQSACKPGVWFQIHTGTDRGTRWLKFADYDRSAGVVRFSNRDGDHAFERSAQTFAEDLQAGRSKPIYDVETFEQRLAAIIGGQASRQVEQ